MKVSNHPEFDRYADEYDAALSQGISLSGEDKHFFARGRIRWLSRCLRQAGTPVKRVLDFGCGTGAAAPYLLELGAEHVIGVDVSERSLAVARRDMQDPRIEFVEMASYEPGGDIDLVFCNGVFHHIPPQDRALALDRIYRSLRPGGWLALWENNPWNPGTHWVMSRIPFDRDAVKLFPRQAHRLIAQSGLTVERTDYLFVFPRWLGWLRFLEQSLSRIPIGAQYQVLAGKRSETGP